MIYLTSDYRNDFIDYYNNEFCNKFNLKKIDNKKLNNIFNLALIYDTCCDFLGYSKILNQISCAGINKISLLDGTILSDKKDIYNYQKQYFNNDKLNFVIDELIHPLACVIECICRCDFELLKQYHGTCYTKIKEILG